MIGNGRDPALASGVLTRAGHIFLVLATFVLVYSVLQISDPTIQLSETQETPIGLGSVGAIRVALIVFAIGLSLGGTTGYAINPAGDLGPRIAHAMLPIPGKGTSD